MIDDKQVFEILGALTDKTLNGSMRWFADNTPRSTERVYWAGLKSGRFSLRFSSPETELDNIRIEITNPNGYYVAALTIWDNDAGWGLARPLLDAIDNQLGRPQETLEAMLQEVRSLAASAS